MSAWAGKPTHSNFVAPHRIGTARGALWAFDSKPSNAATSTFAALIGNGLVVTRHATRLFDLPDDTPVLAHWHGQWRTDAFATTVGELKAKAREFGTS